MSGLIKTRAEVVAQFNAQEFVMDTCRQINKDLNGASELHIKFDSNANENQLGNITRQLEEILSDIKDLEKQAQFVYRVDIPEKDYLEALYNKDLSQLAFLVIRREAQKVYLRNKFS